jgi:hypothetical protein
MDQMHKVIAASFVCLLSAGCSLTLPVKGQVINSTETFSGTATGYSDGAGTLELVSSRGTKCIGQFVYITPRNGQGTATCSDGRAGSFRFASTGTRGTGEGDFGSGKVIFTFGE